MSNTTNGTLYDAQAEYNYQCLMYLDTAFFVEIVCANLIFLVLSIVFIKVEPLKSRGIIPQFALVILLISNSNRIAINFVSSFNTLALTPISVGCLALVWIAAVTQCFRYLIKQRREYRKQHTSNGTVIHKIFNFLFVSNVGLFLCLGFCVICLLIIMAGLWISLFITYTFTNAILAILIPMIIGMFFFSLLLVLVDVIVDVYRYGFFAGTYTLRDPLAFRLNGVMLLICVVMCAIYLVFSNISASFKASEGITQRVVAISAPVIFIEHVLCWCMLLFSGGMCIIIIIKRWVFNKLQGNQDHTLSRADQLQKLWSSEEGRLALFKYCEAEFSVENSKAYDDLCKYKDIKDREEKLNLAKHVYTAYIHDKNSLLLVNASQACKASLAEKMQKIAANGEVDLDTLFDELEVEVRSNLQDTFSRFLHSEAYAKYKRKRSSFAIERAMKV